MPPTTTPSRGAIGFSIGVSVLALLWVPLVATLFQQQRRGRQWPGANLRRQP
jgi:hypothetical protein